MGVSHIIRLAVGLNRKHMPSFVPGSKLIQVKLAAAVSSFPALPVSPATLLQQIADVETADQETKTNRGLLPLRTSKVGVAWNSLKQDCTYCETICQENAEQGLALASSSGFQVIEAGEHVREVIEVDFDPGTGVVHLLANRQMLPPPSGKPYAALTYLWRHSVDGLQTIVEDPTTPTARTTISGLPLGGVVSFGVAVKDRTGAGPWSQWIAAYIH